MQYLCGTIKMQRRAIWELLSIPVGWDESRTVREITIMPGIQGKLTSNKGCLSINISGDLWFTDKLVAIIACVKRAKARGVLALFDTATLPSWTAYCINQGSYTKNSGASILAAIPRLRLTGGEFWNASSRVNVFAAALQSREEVGTPVSLPAYAGVPVKD